MSDVVYRHTPDMGEISGFGGSYEKGCQDMLEAGVKWVVAHDSAELRASEFKGVYGLLMTESDDAKELSELVVEVTGGECSGAMHHAVMSRLMWIAEHGWSEYVEEVREGVAKRQEEPDHD